MTYTHLNKEGKSVTHYTDGLIFLNSQNTTFPGADVTVGAKGKSNQIYLTEGIWYMPHDYRVCIYTAKEILDTNGFLDIDKRVNAPAGYLILDKELEIDLEMSWSNISKEYYYDLTFLEEQDVFDILAEDLSRFDSGNLYTQYSKIEIIDKVFK